MDFMSIEIINITRILTFIHASQKYWNRALYSKNKIKTNLKSMEPTRNHNSAIFMLEDGKLCA
jgi:hypothetical protein